MNLFERRALRRAERKLAPVLEPGDHVKDFDIGVIANINYQRSALPVHAILGDQTLYASTPIGVFKVALTNIAVLEAPGGVWHRQVRMRFNEAVADMMGFDFDFGRSPRKSFQDALWNAVQPSARHGERSSVDLKDSSTWWSEPKVSPEAAIESFRSASNGTLSEQIAFGSETLALSSGDAPSVYLGVDEQQMIWRIDEEDAPAQAIPFTAMKTLSCKKAWEIGGRVLYVEAESQHGWTIRAGDARPFLDELARRLSEAGRDDLLDNRGHISLRK